MNKWFSVKDDGPPKESGRYICYASFGVLFILNYSAKHGLWNVYDESSPRRAKKNAIHDITHWMYEPPHPNRRGIQQ